MKTWRSSVTPAPPCQRSRYRLVRAIDAGIAVTSVPGPSAVTTALAASGLPPQPFRFIGFLPRTSSARAAAHFRTWPATARPSSRSRRRDVVDTLRDALAVLGDREACVARNLTKPHERYQRGALSDLVEQLAAEGDVRGETTLLIAAPTAAPWPQWRRRPMRGSCSTAGRRRARCRTSSPPAME